MSSFTVLRAAIKAIWYLLDKQQKVQAFIVFAMMIIGTFLEILSVGLIFPIISIFSSPDRFEEVIMDLVPFAASYILSMSMDDLFLMLVASLVVVFALKNAYLAALVWFQARLAFGVQSNLSQRLFNNYILQPYSFHLEQNSAQLIRNATTEVNALTFNVLLPMMFLATETLVVAGVTILLVFLQPWGAITSIGVLIVATLIFQKMTFMKIQGDGKARQYLEGKRILHLQQALGGIKEVILNGCEKELLLRFSTDAEKYARVGRTHVTFQQLPRLWIETLAIIGLALLVATMLYLDQPLSEVLPTIALFGAASFRLMPSISRIIANLQSINFSNAVVEVIRKELNVNFPSEDVVRDDASLDLFHDKLELHNLSYSFSGASKPAISNINLSIPYGKTIGIIGSSGAGKSTLVELILGLLEPDEGSIEAGGKDINADKKTWHSQIGYVPQSIFLLDDTIARNIAFGLPEDQISYSKIEKSLKNTQLFHTVMNLPNGVNTPVGERGIRLSGGQCQRIGLARALYHNPNILILDEATSALDEETESDVMRAINDLQGTKTIIMVSHRYKTLKNCDKIYSLNDGKIDWTGSYSELLVRH